MMEPLEETCVYPSRWFNAAMAAFSGVLLPLSAWASLASGELLMLGTLAVFGYGFLVSVRRLRDREPVLILGPDGIAFRSPKPSTVPWNDVGAVRLHDHYFRGLPTGMSIHIDRISGGSLHVDLGIVRRRDWRVRLPMALDGVRGSD